MERRCWRKTAEVLSVSSSPRAYAEDLASSDQKHLADFPQPPPTASMTMGMKDIPCSRHAASVPLCEHLKSSYLAKEDDGSAMESLTLSKRMPLVTAKSRAAGGPNVGGRHRQASWCLGRSPTKSMESHFHKKIRPAASGATSQASPTQGEDLQTV